MYLHRPFVLIYRNVYSPVAVCRCQTGPTVKDPAPCRSSSPLNPEGPNRLHSKVRLAGLPFFHLQARKLRPAACLCAASAFTDLVLFAMLFPFGHCGCLVRWDILCAAEGQHGFSSYFWTCLVLGFRPPFVFSPYSSTIGFRSCWSTITPYMPLSKQARDGKCFDILAKLEMKRKNATTPGRATCGRNKNTALNAEIASPQTNKRTLAAAQSRSTLGIDLSSPICIHARISAWLAEQHLDSRLRRQHWSPPIGLIMASIFVALAIMIIIFMIFGLTNTSLYHLTTSAA